MENLANSISKKVYEDVQNNILKESFNTVFSALARVMEKTDCEKDKEWTMNRLNKTIELTRNLVIKEDKELFDKDIVEKVKIPSMNIKSDLGQVFCYNKGKNVDKEKEIKEEPQENIKLEFIKEIPNAIEIPRSLFDIKLNLTHHPNEYHYFTVYISEENNMDTSYYLTYAERNKFSKRELIALYKEQLPLSLDKLPESIKNKYSFM